jgi:hypothetical protein
MKTIAAFSLFSFYSLIDVCNLGIPESSELMGDGTQGFYWIPGHAHFRLLSDCGRINITVLTCDEFSPSPQSAIGMCVPFQVYTSLGISFSDISSEGTGVLMPKGNYDLYFETGYVTPCEEPLPSSIDTWCRLTFVKSTTPKAEIFKSSQPVPSSLILLDRSGEVLPLAQAFTDPPVADRFTLPRHRLIPPSIFIPPVDIVVKTKLVNISFWDDRAQSAFDEDDVLYKFCDGLTLPIKEELQPADSGAITVTFNGEVIADAIPLGLDRHSYSIEPMLGVNTLTITATRAGDAQIATPCIGINEESLYTGSSLFSFALEAGESASLTLSTD